MAQIQVPVQLPVSYEYDGVESPKGLVILLHGYSQRAHVIREKLRPHLPAGLACLSPDGTFPVPVRHYEGVRLGFAWYLFDPKSQHYIYSMETAVNHIRHLVAHLQLQAVPKWIVGYSQGGYLAPFVARELQNVQQVVILNGRLRHEALPGALPFPIDAIHGEKDAQVELPGSQQSWEAMQALGQKGSFQVVPDGDHGLGPGMLKAFAEVIHRYSPA